MPGISQPFPNIFDPLNFLGSAGSSNSAIRDVRRWRESELTHGRVSMLAALGIIVQEQLLEFKGRPFPFVKGKLPQSIGHRRITSAERTHVVFAVLLAPSIFSTQLCRISFSL